MPNGRKAFQGGSYWLSFRFSDFLKFVFRKTRIRVIVLSRPSLLRALDPWRCVLRLPVRHGPRAAEPLGRRPASHRSSARLPQIRERRRSLLDASPPRSGRANPAAIAALPPAIRSQMAPQRLEKIKSAPGNGMVPETPDPQHLVQERHRRARRAHSRLRFAQRMLRAGEGDGNFPGCKALKSHEMRKGSHPSRLMELRTREAGDEDSSASPRLRGNRRPRASGAKLLAARAGPGKCGRRGGEENYPGCKALKNHKTGK